MQKVGDKQTQGIDVMKMKRPRVPLFSRNPFSPEEDTKIIELVANQVSPNWSFIATFLKGRTPRQCRERWTQYLNPNLRYEPWSEEEDVLLFNLVQKYGHKWTYISTMLPGRSDNDLKNRWYNHLLHAISKDENGNINLMRNENGKICSTKKKRNRKIVCVNHISQQVFEIKKQHMMIVGVSPYIHILPPQPVNKCYIQVPQM